MSAGTRNGNTDSLTDSFIQGLVEKDQTLNESLFGKHEDGRIPWLLCLPAER